MEQTIYQYVLDKLQEKKGKWPKVAAESGMSRRTIEKIARREVKDPGVNGIQLLADYFKRTK